MQQPPSRPIERRAILASLAAAPLSMLTSRLPAAPPGLNYAAMAQRIARALQFHKGERVLVRIDPGYFSELVPPLQALIKERGAVDLGTLPYVDITALEQSKGAAGSPSAAEAFARKLQGVDIYIWMPVRFDIRTTPPAEALALAHWLDRGGSHRQVHFHWAQGSVLADGLPGEHSPELDQVYEKALDVDYAAISAAQDRAIAALRSGTTHIQTPAGTDLRFRVGERPFNKQDGDASAARMKSAQVRVDREVELPCGVLRVAPVEETVQGRLVIPMARMQGKVARKIQFDFVNGRMTKIDAAENLDVVHAELKSGGDAAMQFREFGLGFHPGLKPLPGSEILPYFGYGAGIVRMSLGDNEEIGGDVRGGYRRWFFFPDTTIEIENNVLVRGGELLAPTR